MSYLDKEELAGRLALAKAAAVNHVAQLVAEDGVVLRGIGAKRYAKACPFCGKKGGSFMVADDEKGGGYHCFKASCNAHGDAIGWLMVRRGMTFKDAAGLLYSRAGMANPCQR